MSLPTIQTIHAIPDEKPFAVWQSIVDTLPVHSYFHTPSWCRLLQETLPNIHPLHHYVQFDDGVECIMPGFAVPKRFGFHKYEALPWGTYGNPVGEGVSIEHLQVLSKHPISWKQPIVSFTLHPSFYGRIDRQNSGSLSIRQLYTHILHLNQPYEDIEQQRFQSRLRTAIRKSAHDGVSVRWANDRKTVETCQNIYQKAQERWGGELAVPLNFYNALADKPGEEIRVWIAEYEGQIIAFDVMLYGKREVQYFTGAKQADYDQLNAPKLMMSEVIQDACERGYGLINFGASAGIKGIEQFKERFGGVKTYYGQLTDCHFAFRVFRMPGG